MKSCFRIFRTLAIIVAIGVGVGYSAIQLGRTDYSQPRATVYRIYDASMGDKANSGGSGVMIAPRLMLTAAHVVEDRILTLTAGNLRAPVKVLRVDKDKDLALLLVAIGCPCAAPAIVEPEVDEKLITIGFPLTEGIRVQIATTGAHQGRQLGQFAVSTAQTAPGASGGGVFVWNGAQWRLAGISSAIAQSASPSGFSSWVFPYLSVYASTPSVLEFLRVRSPSELSALAPETFVMPDAAGGAAGAR